MSFQCDVRESNNNNDEDVLLKKVPQGALSRVSRLLTAL